MKITIMACLLAKRDVDIDACHPAKVNAIMSFLRFMSIRVILIREPGLAGPDEDKTSRVYKLPGVFRYQRFRRT